MNTIRISVEIGTTSRFVVNRTTENDIAFAHSVISERVHFKDALDKMTEAARKLSAIGMIELVIIAYPMNEP